MMIPRNSRFPASTSRFLSRKSRHAFGILLLACAVLFPASLAAQSSATGRTRAPSTAQISLNLPSAILDSTVADPVSRIEVYVDGQRVQGTTFTVQAGTREIRVRSGGLSAEISMNVTAGRQYTVTPEFGFDLLSGSIAQQAPVPPSPPAVPAQPTPPAAPAPVAPEKPDVSEPSVPDVPEPAPAAPEPDVPEPAPVEPDKPDDGNYTYPVTMLEDEWLLRDPRVREPLRSLVFTEGGGVEELVLRWTDIPSIASWRFAGGRLELLDSSGALLFRMVDAAGRRFQQTPVPGSPPGWAPLYLEREGATNRGRS